MLSSLWQIFLIVLIRTELVPAFVRLLRDNEAEVRIAAAGKVTKFCAIVNPELSIQHILPCVKVIGSLHSVCLHVYSVFGSKHVCDHGWCLFGSWTFMFDIHYYTCLYLVSFCIHLELWLQNRSYISISCHDALRNATGYVVYLRNCQMILPSMFVLLWLLL